MGATLTGGAKIAWQKLNTRCIVSWTSFCAPIQYSGYTFSNYESPFPTRDCIPYVRSGLYQLVIRVKGNPILVHQTGTTTVTRWDSAGTVSKFGAPMFEPKVFRKQMYCIEESTCDIVGPFRRPHVNSAPPCWFSARGIVPPLIKPLPHVFINCKAASTPRPYLKR